LAAVASTKAIRLRGWSAPSRQQFDAMCGVADIDGIRLLNECQTEGIQVVNCSPYIREWMLQEKRTGEDEE
jgi:hypothetical protein